jgi:nucleotidyltransferase/DNA polymerase involved in DNA repair
MTSVRTIPGIGRTFEKDLRRIGIASIEQLAGEDALALFEQLCLANKADDHATSKNYLYVLRMCIYYANGGRDPDKLRWNVWSDKKLSSSKR